MKKKFENIKILVTDCLWFDDRWSVKKREKGFLKKKRPVLFICYSSISYCSNRKVTDDRWIKLKCDLYIIITDQLNWRKNVRQLFRVGKQTKLLDGLLVRWFLNEKTSVENRFISGLAGIESNVSEIFLNNRIDGISLGFVVRDDLQRMGIVKLDQQLILMQSIHQLLTLVNFLLKFSVE